MNEPFIQFHQTRAEGAPKDEGFALIGLLIVVLILGILAAIVAFAVVAKSARDHPVSDASESAVAACNTDAESVENAVTEFQTANNGATPQSSGALEAAASGGPYLHAFPKNTNYYTITPGKTTGTVNVTLNANDPADHTYGYRTTGITTAQNYDTFRWGGATRITGLNICAGA